MSGAYVEAQLRYSVRLIRSGYVVAMFVHAGAAHRMMQHENQHAEASGHSGPKPLYEVYDNKDKVVMTWGVKRT